jgi:hypothetical protein
MTKGTVQKHEQRRKERKKIKGRDDREFNESEVREETNGEHLDKEPETKQERKQGKNKCDAWKGEV